MRRRRSRSTEAASRTEQNRKEAAAVRGGFTLGSRGRVVPVLLVILVVLIRVLLMRLVRARLLLLLLLLLLLRIPLVEIVVQQRREHVAGLETWASQSASEPASQPAVATLIEGCTYDSQVETGGQAVYMCIVKARQGAYI